MFLSDVFDPVKKGKRSLIIQRELVTKEFCSHGRLRDQVFGCDEDGGPLSAERIISVSICRIRENLRFGWVIRNKFGYGYSLQFNKPLKPLRLFDERYIYN